MRVKVTEDLDCNNFLDELESVDKNVVIPNHRMSKQLILERLSKKQRKKIPR